MPDQDKTTAKLWDQNQVYNFWAQNRSQDHDQVYNISTFWNCFRD